MVDTVIVENETAPVAAVSWPAVLAGAAVAGAFSLMMLALGSGIGLSTFSPWSPNTVDTLRGATFAGIFLAVTAVIASALGGYITGRLRRIWHNTHSDEVVFRDHAMASSPGPLPRSPPRPCWARPAPPWSVASPRKPRATPLNRRLGRALTPI